MRRQSVSVHCVGTLFTPQSQELFPGVIVLPGSDIFIARRKRQRDISTVEIPVEQIACPLLLLSGEKDKIWLRIRSKS